MLVNQEFLMRLLNSSEFVAPPAPPQPPTRGHQYRETIPATKTKQHKTKTDDNRNSCASSCSSKCTCCSTCMDHRPSSLPSPPPRARAGGRTGGRPPSPGNASTVLVSAPGGVCAIAPVEEPGLGSRPRVVPRTGPVNPRKGARPPARAPARSQKKKENIKGKKG